MLNPNNTSPKPNTEFLSQIPDEYVIPKGMPLSVWQNKYSRVKRFVKNEEFDNDTPESNSNQREIPEYQTWGERIKDVVIGNFTLDPRLSEYDPELVGKVLDNPKDYAPKYLATHRAIKDLLETHRLSKQGVMAYAGRHLQHGDPSQYKKIGELYTNCFSGNEKVATLEYGNVKFKDIVGKTVTVRSLDGTWRKAKCSQHGEQKVYSYSFSHKYGRAGTSNLKVKATANHRWYLRDGSVTENLKIGDFITSTPVLETTNKEAIAHGLIFGDGTGHKQKPHYDGVSGETIAQGVQYCSIRLCGNDKKYLEYFDSDKFSVSYPKHAKGDPVVYVGRCRWKDLPHTTDPEYIAGFIYGWWLADGYKARSNENNLVITTTNVEALEWLRDNAALAGYSITRGLDYKKNTQPRIYSIRGKSGYGLPIHEIRLSKNESFKVIAKKFIKVEPVYCVEEPVTNGFMLGNGLMTGNCSTSMFSWSLFFLLLKGSGVGRDYSSATCLVDWNYMPETRFVLEGPDQWGNGGHPDYEPWIESLQSAQHKYDSESERVRWFTVEDSAEGWVKVVTILETAAFHKNNKDHLFIFDFSKIRAKGAPISGQQDRPASGPVPFLQALQNVASIKGAGMKPWKQALFCDHYLASAVALGGIRRAARISTKYWKDRDIIEFADIKREGFLQSANNSILVDAEFWKYVEDTNNRSPWAVHARRLFSAATEAAYMDGTGEPGFINVDKLTSNSANLDKITPDTFINPEYHERLGGMHRQTKSMIKYMLERVTSNKYLYIVNPCVTADTWVATDNGMQQVSSLIKDDGWVEGDELSVTYIVNDEKVKGSPFFATGYKKVYQLTTKEGYTVKLTDNHQVRVEVGRKQKFGGGYTIDYQWVEAKDLEPGDKIVLHNHGLDQKPVQQDSEIEGYTLGLLVGDGCCIATAGRSDSARITLWDNKKDVLPKIKSYTDDLNLTWHEGNGGRTLTTTSVGLAEVAKFWGLTNSSKTLTDEIMGAPRSFLRGFVAGIFDTDGSVQGTVDKGVSLRISSIDKNLIDRLQIVLLRFGMKTTQRKVSDAGVKLLPDSNRNPKEYNTADLYELMLGKDNVTKFFQTFDICNPTHTTKIETINAQYGTRGAYSDRFTAEFVSLDYVGRETVYDVCVPGPHAFSANGFYAHNCSEIPLAIYGGYCIVGDVCLTYARTLEEARKAFGLMAKFLMRVNLMPMLYQSEVKRTNRIGVGFIGIFEFAWNHFGLNFHDVISVMEGATKKVSEDTMERALQFAEFIESCHQEVENSCKEYSIEIGVEVPHTQNCLKPAGTVAKVMNSTEAANLPANNFYLRNNQYLLDDPQYHDLVKRGYPARDISHSYPGHHIVGFPTKQQISDIMGDQCVVVGDTTPKEQYLWLRWLERFWITKGVENTGGQIAYTMKYFPDKVSLAEFQKILMEDQSAVKCCSWMQIMDMSKFAYQPEEPITKEQYDQLLSKIDLKSAEDYDEEQLACAGGICPMERDQLVFVDGTKV